MIKFNNLSFSYEDKEVLKNINFEIEDKDYILIHGENGSGKTTLLKCLLNINKVKNDMIYIDNIDINKFSKFTKIGYVEQYNREKQDISLTSYELFSAISNDKTKIEEVVKKLKIENLLYSDISTMSGGQFQKINIAKSLLFDIKYLILDEPNSGLDFESRQQLYDILKTLNEQGLTIIVISHHLEEVSCQINKIFEIKNNKLIDNPKENCEYC